MSEIPGTETLGAQFSQQSDLRSPVQQQPASRDGMCVAMYQNIGLFATSRTLYRI